MNKLAEKRKQYQEVVDRIKTFSDNQNPSEAQTKTFNDDLELGKKLKGEIEELGKSASAVDDLVKFAAAPASDMPKLEGGVQQKSAGEDVFGVRKDGTFGLVYTDDPLFGSDLMKTLGSDEYRKCFLMTLKSVKDPYAGMDKDQVKLMEEIRRKAASVGIDEDGGFLVPPQMLNEIVRQKPGQTGVVNLVRKQPTSAAAVSMLRMEDSGSDTYTNSGLRIAWTGEGNAPDAQDQPKLKPFTIQVHEGEIEVALTRTFLEDAPAAVESFIGFEMRQSFDLGMEDVVIGGDGVGKPFGITARAGETYGPAEINVGNPVTAAGLLGGFYGLPSQYAANGKIAMRRSVFGDLQSLEDSAGNLIFGVQANFDGLAVSAVEAFRGTRMVFSDFVDDSGAGNHIAIHGDFSSYMLAIRLGMTMRLRDIPGQQPAAVFRFRVGGDLLMGRALKLWKQS